MSKLKSLLLTFIVPAAVLLLEIPPLGAVCKFADGPDQPIIKTFSYFSLTPFGYANFFPLITGVLTAILLILGVLSLAKPDKKLLLARRRVAVAAFITSVLPIVYGPEYLNLFGIMISALLLAQSVLGLAFNE